MFDVRFNLILMCMLLVIFVVVYTLTRLALRNTNQKRNEIEHKLDKIIELLEKNQTS